MSVILIGMPSSGKSTLGVLLAKHLGYRFIDSDLLIQEQEGKRLHVILKEQGLDGFLAIENQVNRSITDKQAVISTGGSVIYGREAMESLKKLGKVAYLYISYEEMEKRLGDYSHRGIALSPGMTLQDMYAQREGLYRQYADVTVDCETCTPAQILEKISRYLGVEG